MLSTTCCVARMRIFATHSKRLLEKGDRGEGRIRFSWSKNFDSTLNPLVVGSIPTRPTNISRACRDAGPYFFQPCDEIVPWISASTARTAPSRCAKGAR